MFNQQSQLILCPWCYICISISWQSSTGPGVVYAINDWMTAIVTVRMTSGVLSHMTQLVALSSLDAPPPEISSIGCARCISEPHLRATSLALCVCLQSGPVYSVGRGRGSIEIASLFEPGSWFFFELLP
jgi:hypothetical protein